MPSTASAPLVDFSHKTRTVKEILESGPERSAAGKKEALTSKDAAANDAAALEPAGKKSGVRLPLQVQHQEQTNWCWSAVSVSVSHYYNQSSPWTQCTLVSAELGAACCENGSSSVCNVAWYLNLALQRTGNLDSYLSTKVPYPRVVGAIDKRRPMCALTNWASGGGHFLAIVGYQTVEGIAYLYLSDPWYGDSLVAYDVFCTNYQGLGGTWTYSYFTES